jgi:2-polyprenyl-3-methyl-5-hydroxy-6-metoxy-1,4-benzoquinol methylase
VARPHSSVSRDQPNTDLSTEPIDSAGNHLIAQTRVASFYDGLGIKEWLRLEADARMRVIFHLHRSVLKQFARAGDRVLDAGAGPGRFSIELACLGALVTAADISAVQVSLARQAAPRSAPAQVPLHFAQLTVASLPFPTDSFDHVVCFGSVLSHCGEQADTAAAELVRVLRPGGMLLISVQSTQNYYLEFMLEQVGRYGLEAVDDVMLRGTQLPDASGVTWRAFGHEEVESLARRIGCEVVCISASNVLATIQNIPLLERLERNKVLWEAFLRWEEHLAQMRGNTERGAHIIAALRKKDTSSIQSSGVE